MSGPDTIKTIPIDRKIYWKSLLQITLPISVTLAEKKIPTSQIVRLVPGAIIHFEKLCDKPLNLEIDGHVIAHGDAVKVGDKFGLKLLEIEKQREKFLRIATKSFGFDREDEGTRISATAPGISPAKV